MHIVIRKNQSAVEQRLSGETKFAILDNVDRAQTTAAPAVYSAVALIAVLIVNDRVLDSNIAPVTLGITGDTSRKTVINRSGEIPPVNVNAINGDGPNVIKNDAAFIKGA